MNSCSQFQIAKEILNKISSSSLNTWYYTYIIFNIITFDIDSQSQNQSKTGEVPGVHNLRGCLVRSRITQVLTMRVSPYSSPNARHCLQMQPVKASHMQLSSIPLNSKSAVSNRCAKYKIVLNSQIINNLFHLSCSI